jgi:hypothetical protein
MGNECRRQGVPLRQWKQNMRSQNDQKRHLRLHRMNHLAWGSREFRLSPQCRWIGSCRKSQPKISRGQVEQIGAWHRRRHRHQAHHMIKARKTKGHRQISASGKALRLDRGRHHSSRAAPLLHRWVETRNLSSHRLHLMAEQPLGFLR